MGNVNWPGWPSFEDATAFVIALILMGFSFYGLLFAPTDAMTENDHLLFAGIITSVATWAFQRNAVNKATQHALAAQNGPIAQLREAVTTASNLSEASGARAEVSAAERR